MMTRSDLDEARALIHDIGNSPEVADAAAVRDLASAAQLLHAEVERLRMMGRAPEQQAAHAQLLLDARQALAASRAGDDPAPFLEHAVKPYGAVPAGARPEQVAADVAAVAAVVMA